MMMGTTLSQFSTVAPAASSMVSERITREPVPPIPNIYSLDMAWNTLLATSR